MLQAARCHGKLQRGLLVLIVVETVEQAAGKAVAAADAVHDVANLVLLGNVEVLAVVQAGRPAVPVGTVALAQRDGDHLHIGIRREHFVAERLVLCAVQLAGLDVHIVHGDLKGLLHVLLVGDGHVDILCDLAHDLARLLAVLPEVLAVVEVAGDGDAALLRLLDGRNGKLHRALADGGRDAGDVEPLHALKGLVPVDIAGLGQRDGGIGTVVDDLARTLVRAALEIVDAHAALARDDALGIHVETAQLRLAGIRDGVIGQDRQERRVLAVVGKGDGHVGLAAAEGGLEHRGLEEALLSGRLQAQHDLTESQKFHRSFLPYFCSRWTAKPPNSCLR